MRRRTVLSMEQALSLSSATLRFAQLGWRVIRLEAAPRGATLPGDPNRYIGAPVAGDDRRSYFVAPNVGKEAIALDLKSARGRELLHRIVRDLPVDVFCCNTLPGRYRALGIDPETLRGVRPELVWAGISAMGPEFPDAPGYDPAIQAMAGYMEVTGAADGPPTLSGIPIIDLKAGDEVYAGVLRALLARAEDDAPAAASTEDDGVIHVSMLRAAASWLVTTLPLLDFDCDPAEVGRCGNEHRKFIPVNAYPTRDGYIFLAIGNDVQWQRLVALPGFEELAQPDRATNAGRHRARTAIHAELAQATASSTTAELRRLFGAARIPHAPIQTIPQVRKTPGVREHLTRTRTPEGRTVHLPPLAVEFPGAVAEYPFAPRYGEHTRGVLEEVGLTPQEITELADSGIIANHS